MREYELNYAILSRLVEERPDDPISHRNIAGIKNLMARYPPGQPRRRPGALKNYREALSHYEIFQRLAPDEQDFARDRIAVSHRLIAVTLREMGDPPAALAEYQESLKIRNSLSPKYLLTQNMRIEARAVRESSTRWARFTSGSATAIAVGVSSIGPWTSARP